MNDTPNSTLSIRLEHFPDLIPLGQIAGEGIDVSAFFLLFRSVRREVVTCDLSDSQKGLGSRVMVIIYRDNLEPASFLKGVDDMRT